MEIIETMVWTILFVIISLLTGLEAQHQCFFSLPEHNAKTFLSAGRRPLKTYCCSGQKKECWAEPEKCPPISEVTCMHGGTCLHNGGCSCISGYTGSKCQIDINECASSPCKSGSTCEDKVNGFFCHCPPRIYGVLCDTNICHPTPADVVFVLDSSISMTEQEFNKQLEFVANFSSQVPIGAHDFQISVVTFSSQAHVEFYLNQYKDNASLHEAIMNVTYKQGITRTDGGLKAVRMQVFSQHHGIERRINGTQASRVVYVLTDGMSNSRSATKFEANELKKVKNTLIAVIGVGNEVLHQELVEIASDTSYVYSVKNFNSLYTVLKQLVHYDCDECETSAASDVLILLDSSNYVTTEQFSLSIDAIMHIIDVMKHLNKLETRVSVTSFSDKIRCILDMGETFNKNAIKSKLNMIIHSTGEDNEQVNLEILYAFINDQFLNKTFSRQNAKRIVLIFTNGKAEITDKYLMDRKKSKLSDNGVNTFAVGSGVDVDLNGLAELVTDKFNVFITKKDVPMNNLDVLQSELVYNKCNLKGE